VVVKKRGSDGLKVRDQSCTHYVPVVSMFAASLEARDGLVLIDLRCGCQALSSLRETVNELPARLRLLRRGNTTAGAAGWRMCPLNRDYLGGCTGQR
jgi:hypothetical protein